MVFINYKANNIIIINILNHHRFRTTQSKNKTFKE